MTRRVPAAYILYPSAHPAEGNVTSQASEHPDPGTTPTAPDVLVQYGNLRISRTFSIEGLTKRIKGT